MFNLIKKCYCISLFISMMMLNCFVVYATEIDKIYVSCEGELREAIKAARPYQEIVLLKDIYVNKIIEIDRPLTINLNEKKISFKNDACFLVGSRKSKTIEYMDLVPQHYECKYKEIKVEESSYINELGLVVRRPDLYRTVIEKVWHEPQYINDKKFHAGYYNTIYRKEVVDGKYYEVNGKLKERPSWVRIVKIPINDSRNTKVNSYTPPTREGKTTQKSFHATSATRDISNQRVITYTPPTRGNQTVKNNFHVTSTTRTDNREDLIDNAEKKSCEQKYIIKEEIVSGEYYEENGQLKKYPSWTRTVKEKVWNMPYYTTEKKYQPGYYEDVLKKVKVDGEYYIDDNRNAVNRPAFYRTVQEKVLVPERKVLKKETFKPQDISLKLMNGRIVSKDGEDGKPNINKKDGENASRAPLCIISGALELSELLIKSGDGGNGASGNKQIGKKGGKGGNGANIIEALGTAYIFYDNCIFKPGLKGRGGNSYASTFIGKLFMRNGRNGKNGTFINRNYTLEKLIAI